MPRFLSLSKMAINLNTVRFISYVPESTAGRESPGCMIYFVGSPEPYGFYGDDARLILAALSDATGGS